jgi:uracil-DNA glycosylase
MTFSLATVSAKDIAPNNLPAAIVAHQEEVRRCRACPDMVPPVVLGGPVVSPVMLIGQAPGAREGPAGKPFAWTAGKTLFRWFAGIGLGEEAFRRRVYMAAVCRCFPGKNPKGGDRVPAPLEVGNCSRWLEREMRLLEPDLVIPVGKLAIAQLTPVNRLSEVIGETHRLSLVGRDVDVIPLPHPSGASTWHRTEPGRLLLAGALEQIGNHRAWKSLL